MVLVKRSLCYMATNRFVTTGFGGKLYTEYSQIVLLDLHTAIVGLKGIPAIVWGLRLTFRVLFRV